MKKLFLLFFSIIFSISVFASDNYKTIKEGEMKILITISNSSGVHKLTAILENNSSASAFYKLVENDSITVEMHDYGNFEKVGNLPRSLPRNDKQIKTKPGDIILYQGNQITIYYDENSWNFTKLGKIVNINQNELKKILGSGNVIAIFSVMM